MTFITASKKKGKPARDKSKCHRSYLYRVDDQSNIGKLQALDAVHAEWSRLLTTLGDEVWTEFTTGTFQPYLLGRASSNQLIKASPLQHSIKQCMCVAEKYKDSGLVDKAGCVSNNRVYFMRGFAHLLTAIDKGEAITVRIHKDKEGWKVSATFDRSSATVKTRPAKLGAIGIDFNQFHLAVSETDKNGNLLRPAIGLTIPTNYTPDMSTGQRVAVLSDALKVIVNYANSVGKPIVIEDLNFARKKELMANKPRTARNAKRHYLLSTLSYSKYLALLVSKCRFAGVELIKVKAAYTSVLGAIKYAKARGLSVHGSAALVITRRGQGFVESLPKTSEVVVPVNGTTVRISLPEGLRSRNEQSAALKAIAKVYYNALFNYFKELNLQTTAEASLDNSMSAA